MTLIANSNTKYVIRVDFYDEWVEMEISIMARKLPIEKYVFLITNGAILEILPMYLPLAETEKMKVTYVY